MNESVEYLDFDDLDGLARALLGDPPPIRDIGLLGSAVARPSTTVFGQDTYPDLVAKASALLHSIVINHALVDGNKRLGWLVKAVSLELNEVRASRLDNDVVYDVVMWIASTNPAFDEIAERLGRHLRQV